MPGVLGQGLGSLISCDWRPGRQARGSSSLAVGTQRQPCPRPVAGLKAAQGLPRSGPMGLDSKRLGSWMQVDFLPLVHEQFGRVDCLKPYSTQQVLASETALLSL